MIKIISCKRGKTKVNEGSEILINSRVLMHIFVGLKIVTK